MQTQIQLMLSKETITNLNKILHSNVQIQPFIKEYKNEVLNILIKNMKIVYKKIDLSKITQTNFSSLFEQYKNHCIQQTIQEITNTYIPNVQSNLKFNRDFNSNPNIGNKLMERPTPTKNENNIQNENFDNTYSQLSNNLLLDNSSNLDSVFQPLVNNNDPNLFNNYNSKIENNIDKNISDIKQNRQNDIFAKQRPPTPDFLKSKQTNQSRTKQHNETNNNSNNNNEIINNNIDFFNLNSNSDNLFSIDNIDKPLIDTNIVEDTASFEDRLKRLQSDRGNNIMIQQTQDKIDFTTEKFIADNINPESNFIKKNNQEINNYNNIISQNQQEQIQEQLYEQHKQEQLYEQKKQIQDQIIQKQLQDQQLQKQLQDQHLQKQIQDQQMQKQIQDQQMQKQIQDQIMQKQLLDQQMQKQIQDQIMQKQIQDLQRQLINITENTQYNNNNEIKQKELENIIQKLNIENIELKNNINQILNKKNNINNYLQLEISDIHNTTKYEWSTTQPIKNVIGIKLISYSIPISKYNIEKYNNKLIINNEEIIIPIGNYTIDNLLNYINNNNNYIDMILDFNQYIKINSKIDHENNKFTINSTFLLKYNFGFSLDKYEDENNIISDNIWDLRLNNKVYLYLTNISDNIPISILNYNGTSIGDFNFEEKIDLNKLSIEFKDQNHNQIDFYNLSHYINLLLIINN